MAGGGVPKHDPKKPKKLGDFGNEVLQESADKAPAPPQKFSLRGILGLGQTIEFQSGKPKSPEVHFGISHLAQEQAVLFNHHQEETKRALAELREEIKKLAKSITSLDKNVEVAILQEIVETSEYQVNFFIRLRKFIATIRDNVSEAGLWVQAFAAKKKKKNYFWNTANNKKKGGTKFMFSDESSVSRNG